MSGKGHQSEYGWIPEEAVFDPDWEKRDLKPGKEKYIINTVGRWCKGLDDNYYWLADWPPGIAEKVLRMK